MTTLTRQTRTKSGRSRKTKKSEIAAPELLKTGWRVYVWDPVQKKKIYIRNPANERWGTWPTSASAVAAQRAAMNGIDLDYTRAGVDVDRQTQAHPFCDVAHRWLRSKGGTTQTHAARKSAVNVLCRRFGDIDFRHLTQEDWLIYDAEEEAAGRASATRENRLGYMRQICKYGVNKLKLRDDDITEDLKISVQRITEPRILTDQELLYLLNFLPHTFWAAAILAYDCGLRAAEVAGLRWMRIDLDSATPRVLIKDVMEGKRVLRNFPKGLKAEWVPLTSRTVTALKVLRAWRSSEQPDDFVFRNSHNQPLQKNDPGRLMKKAWEASGLDGDRARFHHLRHACATNLAMAGAPAMVIMRHTRLEVTQRYIRAAGIGDQRDWMKRVLDGPEAVRGSVAPETIEALLAMLEQSVAPQDVVPIPGRVPVAAG